MHNETANNTAQFEWHFGDGNTATTTSGQQSVIKHTYADAGLYTPRLFVRSAQGCLDSMSGAALTVYAMPEADFSFSPLKPDLDNPEVNFINRSRGANRFEWNFGDGQSSILNNPQHRYTSSGAYLVALLAASDAGCFDLISDTLFISDMVSVYVPNSFTPNGDGLNDVFGPLGSGIQSFRLQVFNRWGAMVFDSEQSQQFWNGKHHQTGEILPNGVYFYLLKLNDIHEKVKSFSGSVVLIR
jgi:gliding motility-associated-like protein